MRKQNSTREDCSGGWAMGGQMEGVGDDEFCVWDAFSAGDLDHLITDIDADTPGEAGHYLGQYQAGAAADIDDTAGGAKGAPCIQLTVNFVQESGIGLVFVKMARRLSEGAIPSGGAGIPARGDFAQESILVNRWRIAFVRQILGHSFFCVDHS